MKLLIITPSTNRGGVEEYGFKIAISAREAGWEVSKAFPKSEGTKSLVEEINKAGINYYPLNIAETHIPGFEEISQKHQALMPILKQLIFPRLKFDLRQIPHFFRTLSLLRKLKPDVVMINLPWADFGFGSMLACGFLKIPSFVIFHLIPYPLTFSKFKRRCYRWARKKQQKWIGVSQSNGHFISQSFGIPKEEVTCIYNGASYKVNPEDDIPAKRRELRQELGLSEKTKIAITIARLDVQKGHDFLIPAIPYLAKDFPDLKFVWVGDGEKKADLLDLLESYKITDRVLFLGYRSDVPTLLQAADLFVFPTYYEGFPFAILEAMAYGLPIISTSTDGIPEVIAHEVHGLLTRKGDSTDLLETIRWALRNSEEMQMMAENAKQRVKDFSQEEMLTTTLSLLAELAKRKTP